MSDNYQGPIGLDVGTSRVVRARREDDRYTYKAELNSFVVLPASKLTASVLRRENVPHSLEGDEILVHGYESEKFADLLEVEIRRPMRAGVINSSEAGSLAMMRQILTGMLGPAASPGQRVTFSVPAPPAGSQDNLTYHEASLRQILAELGYEPQSINEGLAVVYSELEDSNFTGIGISFGGGLCNVCLAYLSVPVVSFSIAKAGDYIDASAAAMTGDLANRVRMTKESTFHFNGVFLEKTQQVLGVYYDEMIQGVVQALEREIGSSRSLPRLGRPVPMVLSGGSAVPGGFRERFEKFLSESKFPLPVSGIRVASEPLHATAKGALVAALSDL